MTMIRSQSELVIVPVVVNDQQGNAVKGISKDKFHILEEGRARPIAIFNELHTTSQVISPVQVLPGIFTNTLNGSQEGRITIIVLDMLNTPFSEQVRVRRETLNFLSQRLQPGETIALLSLERQGLRVLHDFSTDPLVLAKALESLRPGLSSSEKLDLSAQQALVTESQRRLLDFANANGAGSTPQSMDARYYYGRNQQLRMLAAQAQFENDSVYQVTLKSLRLIADTFSGIPGRKALIWATAGIPDIADMPNASIVSRIDYTQYTSTWNALSNANIAVYPLDLRPLINRYYVSASYGTSRRPVGNTVTNLEQFAHLTGGRLCVARMEMENCFHVAAKDSSDYYELGYYTDAKDGDGWRHIKVQVALDNVQVQAREGYFYHRQKQQKDDHSREADLTLAASSPLDMTAIPLKVQWLEQHGDNKKKKVEFAMTFPARAITVERENKNHLGVELFALPRSAEGKSLAAFSQVLAGDVPEADVDKFLLQEIARKGSLELAPGEYEVRFIVRDSQSGRVGTVTAPLTVAK